MSYRQKISLGKATVSPSGPFPAGAWTTVTYVYTAGHPIDDSGCIKIAFRFASDFGTPQFESPSDPHYCSIQTSADCRIVPRWDPKGNTRPWGRSIYLKVSAGYLDSGDTVTLVLGDRSHGSPGWRLQTFCEDTFEFKTLVDPIATYEFKELPTSPEIRIVPGEPHRGLCLAPSQVAVGESFEAHIKAEDRWGNPIGPADAVPCDALSEPGVTTVTLTHADTGLSAESNPIEVRRTPALGRYWADFHGQSEETIGSNTIDDYYRFARDCARVDIAAHQGNDFQVTDSLWEVINDTAARFNEDGRFVTFPGYEWSGNTPLGGDRNIYFSTEGARIVHSCADLLPGKESFYPIAMTAAELFEELGREDQARPFAFAHVGGRYADTVMHDDDIEIAMEVHSAWGTFEWLVKEALERGYNIGICANSDGHKGRPGCSYPGAAKFGSLGGLTCVLAEKLDRDHVLEALFGRRFYATTGHRPLVDIQTSDDQGHSATMGGTLAPQGDTVALAVQIDGTGPLQDVVVFNGTEVCVTRVAYEDGDLGDRVKLTWGGAEVRGRDRLALWDGQASVRGSQITGATPINFWNPDNRPDISADCVSWHSITTGGDSGLILTLADVSNATLEVEMPGRRHTFDLGSLGREPETVPCGGVGKHITVHRLPDRNPPRRLSFETVLHLHDGRNPIWLRATQVDGHRVWTSPIMIRCET